MPEPNLVMRNKQIARFLNEEMVRAFLPDHDTHECSDDNIQLVMSNFGTPKCRRCYMMDAVRNGKVKNNNLEIEIQINNDQGL